MRRKVEKVDVEVFSVGGAHRAVLSVMGDTVTADIESVSERVGTSKAFTRVILDRAARYGLLRETAAGTYRIRVLGRQVLEGTA